MSRILKAYRTRFHQLLRRVGARRPERGVDWLVNKAARASAEEGLPLEQLEKVFCEYGLRLGSPRCMSCGGELARADKESLHDRIPPRTFQWLSEYFLCRTCGKLLWHGTHWLKIVEALKAVEARCAQRRGGQAGAETNAPG